MENVSWARMQEQIAQSSLQVVNILLPIITIIQFNIIGGGVCVTSPTPPVAMPLQI